MRAAGIVIGLVLLIGLGVAGIRFGWFEQSLPTSADDEPAFAWGVYTNTFALSDLDDGGERPEIYDDILTTAKDLGLHYIRTNYEFIPENGLPSAHERTLNGDWIDAILAHGLEPVLILDNGVNTYQAAYDIGRQVGREYKGRVRYYQLMNEVNGAAIKPGHAGRTMTDYEPAKYQAVLNRVKGMSEGIASVDPKARRIITANWLGTAMVDELIADGVEFEIIGWNWFSDMGIDFTTHDLGDGTTLDIPGHFEYSGKKFWLSEVNRQGGSYGTTARDAEAEQASWLLEVATIAHDDPRVSGFFVYTLTDPFLPGQRPDDWGIYRTKQVKHSSANGQTFALDAPKPAATKLKTYLQSLQSTNQ